MSFGFALFTVLIKVRIKSHNGKSSTFYRCPFEKKALKNESILQYMCFCFWYINNFCLDKSQLLLENLGRLIKDNIFEFITWSVNSQEVWRELRRKHWAKRRHRSRGRRPATPGCQSVWEEKKILFKINQSKQLQLQYYYSLSSRKIMH